MTSRSSASRKGSTRGSLDEDARAGAAVLAGVAEDGERRRGGGLLEVGVREDDVGRLAAELERHALDRLGRELADAASDLRRAGEGDLGDVRMLDDPLPDDTAGAVDDVQDALRDPRLERELAELDRGERGQLGGLQDDRVAGRERGTRPSSSRSGAGSSTA